MAQKENEHWLARYASNYHAWKPAVIDGKRVRMRPLGLIESSFDTDGIEYGGRADMNALLTLEINHILPTKEAFRHRIALAWASLRLQHILLMSRRIVDEQSGTKNFVIDLHNSTLEAIKDAKESIVWVEDFYPEVNIEKMYAHCQNVGRIVDPHKCLSKLHVLPLTKLPNDNFELHFLLIMGHQISDGLSAYNWFSHFIRILNMPEADIEQEISALKQEEEVQKRLPPTQEDLYPKVVGSKARQRWFWAVMRVLRHMRRPLPPTFVNPLRRQERLKEAVSFTPIFDQIFDYGVEKMPPMNSGHVTATLSPAASEKMIELCKEIKVSVGAGCFALAGISMMELYEARYPHITPDRRLPFTASFPLNPRAFFGFTTPANSCMLSFSDGIVMPFLPSDLPIEGRFKIIARHANRELRMYQKRLKGGKVGVGHTFDAHSPSRLLANDYLLSVERAESKLPPHRRTGINPQGSLPANFGKFGATCGVSSVGSTSPFFKYGAYDLSSVRKGENDFAVDYKRLKLGVRARENEFLVGSNTDARGIVIFSVSYDMNSINEEAAKMWAEKIKALLGGSKEDRAKL